MAESERLTSILSGIAGQFFVAAEISRKGHIATLTLRNTRGIDMLVARADGSDSVGIQVKTNQGSKKVWLLDKKSEEFGSGNLVYVFVNLNGEGAPEFHIVPGEVVADYAPLSNAALPASGGRALSGMSASISTVVRSKTAGIICEATNRCQMSL